MATTLSLVAMFDDFRRNRSVLTQGIETGKQMFPALQFEVFEPVCLFGGIMGI